MKSLTIVIIAFLISPTLFGAPSDFEEENKRITIKNRSDLGEDTMVKLVFTYTGTLPCIHGTDVTLPGELVEKEIGRYHLTFDRQVQTPTSRDRCFSDLTGSFWIDTKEQFFSIGYIDLIFSVPNGVDIQQQIFVPFAE